MLKTLTFLFLIILLAGCAPAKEEGTVEVKVPFAGGTEGLSIDFSDFRKEVLDGGTDPFNVIVKLENKGETNVAPNRVRVKLTGINPREFGKVEEDLIKNAPEEITGVRKDPEGNILPGTPVFVEFTELNHFLPIAGARAPFTLRAEVCYLYSTKAVSKLCVRSNILAPEPGGICEINENKPVYNSGAPVQIGTLKETAGGKDKIRFSFEIINAKTGQLFERGSGCDKSTRAKENKVYVIVNTGMPGLQCTGLTTSGTKAEGLVTLFEGKKIVSCSQTVTTRTDYEQLVNIEVIYDYEEFKQTELIVKSSGETAETS